MYYTKFIFLIGLVSTCLITSCSKSIDEAIIGKWHNTETSEYMEFFADHTFVITSNGSGSISGKWSRVGSDRFKLDMVVFGTPGIVTMDGVTIVGDEMKATIAGKAGTASRVKYGSQDTGGNAGFPSVRENSTRNEVSNSAVASGKRNAQNLASVSAAACAAGATKAQLGTDLRSAIATLTKGVNVTNNGQVMGPFRVDGLPDDLSLVTRNLTFDQNTGVIRYTPPTDQTQTNTLDPQQSIYAGKRNAQNLASVSAAAAAAGATKVQLGTDLRSAIANLSNGITVISNGQVMGPFKVDGLPDDLSQTTSNLAFDQATGIIRYTPSTEQIGTFTPNSQQAAISAGKRNAQNLASVSAAAVAAGATRAQLGTDLMSAISTLAQGITVINNGQVMGPFKVDGLPANISLVTINLTFDQATGIIRYTPANDQTLANIRIPNQDISAAKRNAQNLASVASAARAAGYTKRWTTKEAAIQELLKGITVVSNGNTFGPFRVDFPSPDQVEPASRYLRLVGDNLVYTP